MFGEDDEIAMYFLDMVCSLCGSLARAPYPGWEREYEDEGLVDA